MSNDQQVRIYNPSEEMVKNAAVSGMEGYRALCKEAEDDYEGFWARRANEMLDWKVPFTQVLDDSNAPFFKWFADGKLNVSYNCVDRNVEGGPVGKFFRKASISSFFPLARRGWAARRSATVAKRESRRARECMRTF